MFAGESLINIKYVDRGLYCRLSNGIQIVDIIPPFPDDFSRLELTLSIGNHRLQAQNIQNIANIENIEYIDLYVNV